MFVLVCLACVCVVLRALIQYDTLCVAACSERNASQQQINCNAQQQHIQAQTKAGIYTFTMVNTKRRRRRPRALTPQRKPGRRRRSVHHPGGRPHGGGCLGCRDLLPRLGIEDVHGIHKQILVTSCQEGQRLLHCRVVLAR